MLTRRDMIRGGVGAAFFPFNRAARGGNSAIVAGAIRWDGWYEHRDLSIFPQFNISPTEFRQRAPLHCDVDSTGVTCVGDQKTIDTEILAAKSSGLSYWAFCWFEKGDSFRRAWEYYQSSNIKPLIKWCAILTLRWLKPSKFETRAIQQLADSWLELFSHADYQKVGLVGETKPLVYIMFIQKDLDAHFGGDTDKLRVCLREFKVRSSRFGIGSPYFVFFHSGNDPFILRASGADAISNYVNRLVPREKGQYGDLDLQARAYWDWMANTGLEVVPIAQIGWDVRPRIKNPLPWGGGNSGFYYMATACEFAEHIRAAKRFVETNPEKCPHRLLLIYSWNECDEGGCINPTLGDASGKYLDAMKSALVGRDDGDAC
jgi:hypothetical protein